MRVELNARELLLIRNGLYLLESAIYGDELHHDMASDIGAVEPEEVRELMDNLVPENLE